MAKRTGKLSYRQRAFLEAYLATWNATEAARRTGYAHPDVQGPRMLVNDGIRAAIDAALAERCMSAQEVLDRLSNQARVNAAQFFIFSEHGEGDEEGEEAGRVHMAGIDWAFFRDHGYLVKKLGYTRDGRPVIEFHDPQRALELLARRHGLLVDRHEHSGPGGVKIPIGIEVVQPDSSPVMDEGGDDDEP